MSGAAGPRKAYRANERAWVKRILARLTPEQYARYVLAMREASGHSNNGKKYDDLKAKTAEKILYEDRMKEQGA